MVDYKKTTGTTGELMIRDDGSMVEFLIRSHSALALSQLPWTYSLGANEKPWQSFNFKAVTTWQSLGIQTISESTTVTLKLGYTNTSLGGPTSLVAEIFRTPPEEEDPTTDPSDPAVVRLRGAIIQTGPEEQKLAIPYVNVNGVWKRAASWAKAAGVWKETT